MRPIALFAVLAAAGGLAGCGGSAHRGATVAGRPAAPTPIPESAASVALTPGRAYVTGIFRPRVTLTLPPGSWRTAAPETRSSVSIGLDAAPPTRSATLALVHIHRVFDSVRGGSTAADTVPLRGDFLAWLRSDPRLRVGVTVPVEIGRRPGRQVDVTVRSGPRRRPAECGSRRCLPLYLDGADPVDFAIGDRVRYIAIQVAGAPLLIEMYVGPGSRFATELPRLEAALKGIGFPVAWRDGGRPPSATG